MLMPLKLRFEQTIRRVWSSSLVNAGDLPLVSEVAVIYSFAWRIRIP
jgi:hypothetical protein